MAFDDLLQDLRYTFRTLRRDAGFAIFAILIAGLGIGASATVFSVVNTLLLRPLPFAEPERLVWIANHDTSGLSGQTTQVGHMLDLRERTQSLSAIAGYFAFYGVGDNLLSGRGEPERLSGVPVSDNFFEVLGVQPQLGRTFTAEESKWNGPKAVHARPRLWERRFDSDPAIVGTSLTLNDEPHTVVGVLPASFDFASVFAPGSHFDLYFPFPLSPETNRWGNTMAMIGRLKPGVTAAQAQAEIRTLAAQITREHPERNSFEGNVRPLADQVSGRMRLAVWVLAGAVGDGHADRLRQPVEPAAGAHGGAAEGDGDSHRARRRAPAADRADADRRASCCRAAARSLGLAARDRRHARAGAPRRGQHPAAARACAPTRPRSASRWRSRSSPASSSGSRRRCRRAARR